MTDWPIGLSTGCFYQQSILDCLPVIRESGFGTVEVCSSTSHLDYHNLAMVHRTVARQIALSGQEVNSSGASRLPRVSD
jgi:hypothetical protein